MFQLPPSTIPRFDAGDEFDCRTVRIFISSTFKDFYNEREVLLKKVFPVLRDFCDQKGLFLVECDLRWGVPKDSTSNQAILTCLDEIQRAIEEMRGNNFFLGLVGDRYGWVPSQEDISGHIMQKYGWFENASVTLMEMIHGALRTMSKNSLIMLREGGDAYNEIPEKHLRDFVESNPDCQKKVEMAKEILTKHLGSANQVLSYSFKYSGLLQDSLSKRERVILSNLEDFEEKVLQFFKNAITTTFNLEKKDDNILNEHKILLSALQRSAMESVIISDEIEQLIKDPQSLLSVKIEDKDEEDNIISLEGNSVACLVGAPGSGKSTMMATLIHRLKNIVGQDRIFYHFSGASIASKMESNLVKRIKSDLDLNEEDQAKESITFVDMIKKLSERHLPHAFYIFIDALDEMASDRKWLPTQPLPSNICCVFSCLEGPTQYQIPSNISVTLNLPPLTAHQTNTFIKTYFNEYGKRLDEEDLNRLIHHQSATNPLWLSLACEEIRLHGDYSSLSSVISSMPDDIANLYNKILTRIIEQDTSGLTTIFLQLLYISRIGLWENEVVKLLSKFSKVKDIAQATVTDIFRSLKIFVHMVGVPVPIVKLRHRIVSEVLRVTVFTGEDHSEEIKRLHSKMANYFQEAIASNPAGNFSNYQHLEMVFHRYRAGERATVMRELWSPMGQRTFPVHHRSRIFNALRCGHMCTPFSPSASKPALVQRACTFCLNDRLQPLGNFCYYCGYPTSTSYSRKARMCSLHEHSKHDWNSICAICDRFMHPTMLKPLNLCMLCDGLGAFCSVLVKETDFYFNLTATSRINVDYCFAI